MAVGALTLLLQRRLLMYIAPVHNISYISHVCDFRPELMQLVRRSEGLQLVWHGRYLAALAAHEESHDALVAAMAEQLSQLQGACSQQIAALDTLHTQVCSMTDFSSPCVPHVCLSHHWGRWMLNNPHV